MSISAKIAHFFRALVFDFRFAAARREANRRAALSGRKHLVVVLNRRPVVVSKQRIKFLIKSGEFKKGVTAADIEAKAIYRTF